MIVSCLLLGICHERMGIYSQRMGILSEKMRSNIFSQ